MKTLEGVWVRVSHCSIACGRLRAGRRSGIAGVVRDTSGGVLPGVTVEVASPALIEKVRSAVTDGEGQYKIVDLRPGVYSVTFTLTGFNTFKREGIELSAGFTASDQRRPQGRFARGNDHRRRAVADRRHAERDAAEGHHHGGDPVAAEHRDELRGAHARRVAATRTSAAAAAPIPEPPSPFTAARGQDTRRLIDGMRWNSMEVGNSGTGFYFDPTGAEEVSIQLGGNSAEYELGGVQVNLMPKSGGNTLRGYLFAGVHERELEHRPPCPTICRRAACRPSAPSITSTTSAVRSAVRSSRTSCGFSRRNRWWGNSQFVPGPLLQQGHVGVDLRARL